MDRFHKIHVIERKATWRMYMVRRENDEETHDLKTRHRMAINVMSDASKRKAKQKWAIEKPKLDNARQLRCIFFIEPDDEEF